MKLMENWEFVEVNIDEVAVGDVLLVKTGAKVPVDGSVLAGEGYVNEAKHYRRVASRSPKKRSKGLCRDDPGKRDPADCR